MLRVARLGRPVQQRLRVLSDLKQMGLGLAVAVLLDATVIRGVLLGATMELLGEWNWYLPKWLERAHRDAFSGTG